MKFDDVVDGKVFRAYHDEVIAGDGTLILQFTTPPDKTVIFERIGITSITTNIRMINYKVNSLTEGSTPVHIINSNFQMNTQPNTVMTSDPTNISGREKKSSILVPAITSGPSSKIVSPFTLSDDNFSLLEPDTDYTIELTNKSADTETLVDIQILFREL